MGLHPRGGGGGEEGLRVTSPGFQISAQGHGRYGSIANLGPFVAKDHPRIALGIDVEGALGLGLHAGDDGPNEPYDAECESYEFQDNGPFEQR